eukprot:1193282-Prorocentrum_minimum.AAC.7
MNFRGRAGHGDRDAKFKGTFEPPPLHESKKEAFKRKFKANGLTLFNQVKSGKGLDILPEKARLWVPPVVTDRVNSGLQTTVQNLAPVVQGRMAELSGRLYHVPPAPVYHCRVKRELKGSLNQPQRSD